MASVATGVDIAAAVGTRRRRFMERKSLLPLLLFLPPALILFTLFVVLPMVDAATFSASGVDPHISEANAAIQAHRIAAVRRLPLARVTELIADSTDGRGLGVFGEPGVNVTKLNLALDQEAR
jgi:ABC-type sugar transport system permease subunit